MTSTDADTQKAKNATRKKDRAARDMAPPRPLPGRWYDSYCQ